MFYVGAGAQFATIQAAFDWLKTKIINAIVTIQVLPGTYSWPNMFFAGFPAPHLLRIVGDLVTPSNVVLQYNVNADQWFIEFRGIGTAGITFSGFELVSTVSNGHALVLRAGARISTSADVGLTSESGDKGQLQVSGFYTAIFLDADGLTPCEINGHITLNNNLGGVQMNHGSAHLSGTITGNSAASSFGFSITTGALVNLADGMVVSNVQYGYYCYSGAAIFSATAATTGSGVTTPITCSNFYN